MINRIFLAAILFILIANNLSAREYMISPIEDSTEIQDDKSENKTTPNKRIASDTDGLRPLPDPVLLATDSSLSSYDENEKIKKPWPTGALLRSALVPGWGQFYNKKYIKTVIYGGLEIYFAYKARKLWRQMDEHQGKFQNSEDPAYQEKEFRLYEDKRNSRNLFLWLTGLTVFVSMFDAYVDAHMAGFDQSDKAFEVHLVPEIDRVKISLAYNF